MKRWYLLPFALLYSLITSLRNLLYQGGILRSYRMPVPVICVGNLSVGGSGKSPMVMYLAELLSRRQSTGVLSRGYGRKSTGYLVANYHSTPQLIGDEAMQLFTRFRNRIVIAVCEDRVEGAKRMIRDMDLKSIILDDAFQHRRIRASLNILLTDYNQPFFTDYHLPAGDLRESRSGKKRADIIVVTKCEPNISEEKMQYYRTRIAPGTHQHLFFSSIQYDDHVHSHESKIPDNNLAYYDILLITGIAKPGMMLQHLQRFTQKKITHLEFRDHHDYTASDIKKIEKAWAGLSNYRMILTTEKDYVKLQRFPFLKDKLYYWPISTVIANRAEFDRLILEHAVPGLRT